MCQQVKLWRFLGGRVGSMQAKELRKLTVTLTASRKLACGIPSCLVNPFGSGKDKINEDEQEDFTGLQYFKRPVEIS